MDRFLSIEAFVTVAETQSFAEAARQMRISKSVITTRIQQLEEYVGAPLFHRSTRNVQLSEVGQAYLRDCVDLVNRTDELVDQMRELKGSLVGRLKVHALPGFVLGHMAAHLREFQEKYPDIVLELFVNDAVVDPIKAGVDCALQIFNPSSEELIGRQLFPVRRIFCASPDYLKHHGTPQHPRDLYEHRLGLYSGYPTRDRWVFHGANEKVVLDLKPVLLSNSVHLLEEYACEHAGIVCIPTLVAAAPILSGSLKLILPDWQLSSFWLSVVYPRTHRGGAKLKLFIESLLAKFSSEQPWDLALIEQGLMPRSLVE
ncbi:LysR family transcriptional regulator [Undibacterium arcticum]|uniref:LysR family transcriptional regulator n=1 Tax=Undibacterium arcticum TaxID=1762892 RepID=A0ABV7FAP0_9BURK